MEVIVKKRSILYFIMLNTGVASLFFMDRQDLISNISPWVVIVSSLWFLRSCVQIKFALKEKQRAWLSFFGLLVLELLFFSEVAYMCFQLIWKDETKGMGRLESLGFTEYLQMVFLFLVILEMLKWAMKEKIIRLREV